MSESGFVGAMVILCVVCVLGMSGLIAFLLIVSDAVGTIRLGRRKPRQKPPTRF